MIPGYLEGPRAGVRGILFGEQNACLPSYQYGGLCGRTRIKQQKAGGRYPPAFVIHS